METDKLRVISCQLCNYFKNLPEDIKLYYPVDRTKISETEFIIIECKQCKQPVVIYGEHVISITKESYGRILYRCRMLFGNDVIIKSGHRILDDHLTLHKIGKF